VAEERGAEQPHASHAGSNARALASIPALRDRRPWFNRAMIGRAVALCGILPLVAGAARGDDTVPGKARRAWIESCRARLEQARLRMAAREPAFRDARVETVDGALRLEVLRDETWWTVSLTPRSEGEFAGNPPGEWQHRPIIDKSYNVTKLNMFRFGAALEARLVAGRNDASPRAPPIPAWLRPFVDAFQPAVDSCLSDRGSGPR
jgi:hypothetical protein